MRLKKFSLIVLCTALTVCGVIQSGSAADAIEGLPPCDQEMTTCPCNGVRVDKNLIQAGDVLMIRLEGTSVVSFPLKVD